VRPCFRLQDRHIACRPGRRERVRCREA
jgi:hypothetical protein